MLSGMTAREIEMLGLDAETIGLHQQRIKHALLNREQLLIPIQDTCRIDNGGILPARYLRQLSAQPASGFVAFVPAAGAASRYFQPLAGLRTALITQNQADIAAQHASLRALGSESWPLPSHLSSFLQQEFKVYPGKETIQNLIQAIDLPKALLPCWKNGPSFLQMKTIEHQSIEGVDAEFFIAPLHQTHLFKENLQSSSDLPSYFLEQTHELSTIRFLPNGLPFRDQKDQLSLVPAGHGMLVNLFPNIRRQVKDAHSLFIRNIDNVNGTMPEVLAETGQFLQQHQLVLTEVRQIRKLLKIAKFVEAASLAKELLANFSPPSNPAPPHWLLQTDSPWTQLWHLLLFGFHCPSELALELRNRLGDLNSLIELYDRPLNSLGQVPNAGHDIGGTPVFALTKQGKVSICLELPHVSTLDRQKFLENASLATHFNPVFAAAEIPENPDAYNLRQCPFWVLADKKVHGQAVVYHEIVLYEIIGNSITANILFPEISRRLFHPHKTLTDSLNPNSSAPLMSSP